ncbi:hypothetical protein GOP47_0016187 [Adiantum capillus-veneris]|uniref:Pollen-specific protein SF21 n=1 Tax=Adiantum capillus-veneris TaxID=13818 RepID=A0A9D4ULX9_ADICA|nr:hypothetical protein GOP47_0015956 [Adiantum capillus-veneris]KAI5069886.1 hypothetical protein GOP47_0016187 [Adiantum capillus-veneris]
MCDSPSARICVDIETIPWGGQEHVVKTSFGSISVYVCGDQEKPALITYPDVALNYMSCFQGLLFCPEAASLLLHNFCIYHIDAPGHELGAAAISRDEPALHVEDLADQVAEVLEYFRLQEVMCMGVMAGAYILTVFALKHPDRILGLILVSPLCRAPSWSEWLYNKLMVNVLYFYGMCNLVKDLLLQRYFSQELRVGPGYESDIVQACRRLLDERQSVNVMRFLQAIDQRVDLSEGLKKLKCRTLIFAGEHSSFHKEALYFANQMDRRFMALVEVQGCGSLVTEEQPHSMLVPLEYFLRAFGFYRRVTQHHQMAGYYSHSPTSPLSPPCIAPELLSPESLGLKLKPIRTRVRSEEV